MKELNSRIRDFNEGKYQILIGTSTVEEGLDVQSCDVVMVFTDLVTSKSYIQMKGRARKEKAKFLVFTNNKEKTVGYIKDFIELAKCMKKLFPENSIVQNFSRENYLNEKKITYKTYFVASTHAKVSIKNVAGLFNELAQQFANSKIRN